MLEVGAGWERAVETVLGDYLEAVRVDSLDALESSLGALAGGSVGFFEARRRRRAPPAESTLAAHVRGPDAVLGAAGRRAHQSTRWLRRCGLRRTLAAGESLITAAGEWIGRDWLRINRGGETHAGVLEREQRLKGLRERLNAADQSVRALEQEIARAAPAKSAPPSEQRDATQGRIQSAHREHAELLGRLEALRARVEEGPLRRGRIEAEQAEVAAEARTHRGEPAAARAPRTTRPATHWRGWTTRAATLEGEREQRRDEAARARADAQARAARPARQPDPAREPARGPQFDGSARWRGCSSSARSCEAQHETLEQTLAQADAPIADAETRLQDHLSRRVEVEGGAGRCARALRRTASRRCARSTAPAERRAARRRGA